MTHRPIRIVLLVLLSALGLIALPAAAGAAPSFVDTQVKANILLLQGYINAAGLKNEFVYPAVATVKQGGGLAAPIWPANPWTGKTMVPAGSRGNFTYALTATGYRLVGHLSKGTYVVTGGVPDWLRDDSAKTGASLLAQYVDMLVTGQRRRVSGRRPGRRGRPGRHAARHVPVASGPLAARRHDAGHWRRAVHLRVSRHELHAQRASRGGGSWSPGH